MFEISFYEKENGKIPVKDFLLDLELKMRAKALKEIEKVIEYKIDYVRRNENEI